MVGAETQVHPAQLVVAAQQQARSGQQYQGYSKLTDHKNGTHASMTASHAGCASTLFERIVHAGAGGHIGRQNSTRQTGQDGDRDGKQNHLPVKPDRTDPRQ